nr:MAG TPA: hypothetical protein [Caudoviricetes sp.]
MLLKKTTLFSPMKQKGCPKRVSQNLIVYH